MKAAYIEETGPPEAIVYGDLPTPEPEGAEVLVRVAAVAVNPIDTYIRGGANYWDLPSPYIIGCDLAGTVEAVGPLAQRYRPGDRVWGSNQGIRGHQGTFAEYAAVTERWLYPTPESVSEEDAAAGALVSITAHLGLFSRAQLKSCEVIWIQGGSGGVGSCVVQMAKAIGALVFATAGTDEKVAACRELGADVAVNYNTEDVSARRADFAPDGVDVFWETQREPDLDFIVDQLAPKGRIVLMAGRDARPPFPVGPFYGKGCSMHGFVIFDATSTEQRACAKDIDRWMASGQLRPRIDRVLPLADAAAAHRLQEESTVDRSGALAGKIILRCWDS